VVVVSPPESQAKSLRFKGQSWEDEAIHPFRTHGVGRPGLEDSEPASDPGWPRILRTGYLLDFRENQPGIFPLQDDGDRHSVPSRKGLLQKGPRLDLFAKVQIAGEPHGFPLTPSRVQLSNGLKPPETAQYGFAQRFSGLWGEGITLFQKISPQADLFRSLMRMRPSFLNLLLQDRHAAAPSARRREALRRIACVG
jgi:hypothetical protein